MQKINNVFSFTFQGAQCVQLVFSQNPLVSSEKGRSTVDKTITGKSYYLTYLQGKFTGVHVKMYVM